MNEPETCLRQTKNSLSKGEAVKFVSDMAANVQCGSLVATCQPRERCLTIAFLQYLQWEPCAVCCNLSTTTKPAV